MSMLDPRPYAFRASMAYVGLDPRKDINWVSHSAVGRCGMHIAATPRSVS